MSEAIKLMAMHEFMQATDRMLQQIMMSVAEMNLRMQRLEARIEALENPHERHS